METIIQILEIVAITLVISLLVCMHFATKYICKMIAEHIRDFVDKRGGNK